MSVLIEMRRVSKEKELEVLLFVENDYCFCYIEVIIEILEFFLFLIFYEKGFIGIGLSWSWRNRE